MKPTGQISKKTIVRSKKITSAINASDLGLPFLGVCEAKDTDLPAIIPTKSCHKALTREISIIFLILSRMIISYQVNKEDLSSTHKQDGGVPHPAM